MAAVLRCPSRGFRGRWRPGELLVARRLTVRTRVRAASRTASSGSSYGNTQTVLFTGSGAGIAPRSRRSDRIALSKPSDIGIDLAGNPRRSLDQIGDVADARRHVSSTPRAAVKAVRKSAVRKSAASGDVVDE
jgi:hypothetical protein